MRLWDDGDEERAFDTIAAAAESGITVFDTARAYGDNERLLVDALRRAGASERARIATKGGMSRPDGAWIPDGRARSIRADCEASLIALDGLEIDLYLLHAPDPRTPWRTSLRALAKLVDDGVVARVGVSNVNRDQLDEALEHVPIAAVQVALSPFDDRALRGGVVDRCVEAGVTLIAHSPLGGPRRAKNLGRNEALAAVAETWDVSAAEVALAWLLDLAPDIVAIPGARRPATARSASRAGSLQLDDPERELLRSALGRPRAAPSRRPRGARADVVVVMGVPGAGKTLLADEYVARGYLRLNRDERGGTLRELADALDDALSAGESKVVLDNTYLTRASRSHVVEAAARHAAHVRCTWLDIPLAQAQVNLVERLLDRFGELPAPDELKAIARAEPGLHTPTTQMRTFRELEPPSHDEGFDAVERVPFARTPPGEWRGTGVFVAAAVVDQPGWERLLAEADPGSPHLVFDWRPDGSATDLGGVAVALAAHVGGPIEAAVCPHPGGPPICWCRPPLPGLPLAFARKHGIDPTRAILVGTSTAHRTLAATLGARFVEG
jgi:aryl-alcohol dehydrogenase-like predicted oxidoreductase/predicted kinase